jgi:hypothetical protein
MWIQPITGASVSFTKGRKPTVIKTAAKVAIDGIMFTSPVPDTPEEAEFFNSHIAKLAKSSEF